MEQVAGKLAFITGGASGLGLAMARSFSAAGMKVVIADIEDTALQAAKAEFSDTNADVITMKVDVTSREAMEQAAEDTIAAFGKIHVVCNNAGVAVSGNVSEMTYKDWDWVMKVNVDGVVNGVVSFADHMKAHGEGGHFVNTASIAGLLGIAGLSVYNTSKFAVVGMSEAMRVDLEPFGIGTSVLCPGVVATNIFSSERNRPDQLGGTEANPLQLAGGTVSEEEREARMKEMNALDPSLIGDMVLHAIQTNEFYIFSHEEFGQGVSSRAQEMSDAFSKWAAFKQARDA